MKPFTTLALATTAFIFLGSSLAVGDQRSGTGCIQLWPDLQGFDSTMPDAEKIGEAVKERFTGHMGHLVAYVDHVDGSGRSAFVPFPRNMYVFATESGRYVVRILDLPHDHGWYGPF